MRLLACPLSKNELHQNEKTHERLHQQFLVGFVTAITLVGIIACAVLLWMAGRKKVVSTADNTTGHVWDVDLRR